MWRWNLHSQKWEFRNPTLRQVWRWNSQSQKWELGVFWTPKTLELDYRGQNTSPWSVLYTVGKVLKIRCGKWPHMSHSDICSTSYGWKKGWQFDSRPLKVENQPDPGVCKWSATHRWKLLRRAISLIQSSSQSEVWAGSYELPKSRESKPGHFRDSSLGVPGQKPQV
jgi:hypothetical protein